MRRDLALGIVCALVLTPHGARAATQIGVRGGYASVKGEVFPGSGDMGGGGLYGLTLTLGLVPKIDLEFAWERYQQDFSFSEAAFEETFFGGEGSYETQNLLLTGKLHLPIGGLFGIYGGFGASLQRADLSVDSDDPSVQDYLDQIDGLSQEAAWNLSTGIQFKIPEVPLLIYGEYRYQDVTGGSDVRSSSAYAGLNLYWE